MDRPRRRLAAELLPVVLVLASLAGTLAAVVSLHRRPTARRVVARPTIAPAVVSPTPTPIPVVAAPAPSPPAPVDPTGPMVAVLASAEAKERAEAEAADRRAEALEAAARSAKGEAAKSRRGLTLARMQLDALATLAGSREVDAEFVGMERDALARRRDALKEAVKADLERPAGWAVLPHKGPNGTWQRPVVIECADGTATLRPNGPTFGLMEITSPYGVRSSPFVAAVAREAVRVGRRSAPDGEEVTPYIFFVVRPDGIRPYYEARARLERLGVAFGYELADADWAIDVPDLDRAGTWDGSPPPLAGADDALARPSAAGAGGGNPGTGRDNPFVWPQTPAGLDEEGDRSRPRGRLTAAEGIRSGDRDRQGLPTGVAGQAGEGPISPGGGGIPPVDGAIAPHRRAGGVSRVSPTGVARSGREADTPRSPRSDRGEWDAAWDRALTPGGPRRPVGLDPAVEDRERFAPIGSDLSGPLPPRGGRGPEADQSTPSSGSVAGGTHARSRSGQGSTGVGGETPGDGRASGGNGGGPGLPGEGGTVRPMELVLACGPKGVAIHPGDYRVTVDAMKGADPLLASQLRALVRQQEIAHPGTTVVPTLRYVIAPGGRESYGSARGQAAVEGIDWPSTIQVSGGDILRLYSSDAW